MSANRSERLWRAVTRLVWLGAGLALLAAPTPAHAQLAEGDEGDVTPTVFLPRDDDGLRFYREAQRYIEQGNYARAVRLLGEILDSPEDSFLDTGDSRERGLKHEVHRLIGEMPRRGRELYELQFGPMARTLLDEAIAARDAERMAQVSGRFFHTRAGYEATFLLGLHQANHGWWPEAALTLDHLRRESPIADRFEPTLSLALAVGWVQVDQPEKARQTLKSLRARRSGPTIEFAGRAVPWFEDGKELEWLGEAEPVLGLTVAVAWLRAGRDDEARKTLQSLRDRHGNSPIRIGEAEIPWFREDRDAVAWLTGEVTEHLPWGASQVFQWTMFRGDPARNARSPGGAPLLRLRWRVPVSDDPSRENILEQLRQTARDHGQAAIPGLHPLIVDVKDFAIQRPNKPPWVIEDVVLMRTAQNLLAVDFTTGKRLWEVPVEEDQIDPSLPTGVRSPNLMQMVQGLGRRVWSDATYGTLSSDGRFVFSIENLGFYQFRPYPTHVMVNGTNVSGLKPFNQLCAREIRTGKLKWPDPRADEDSDGSSLSKAFFLGPPLPLMGRLYGVVEMNKGEIRLVALDVEKGRLAWSQQLAVVEQDITADPARRLAGVSPSFGDGILVCPTSVGAIVAVDLSTRSLMWSYLLPKKYLSQHERARLMQSRSLGAMTQGDGWIDSSVTISDGRVVVTPAESDYLLCLNLMDGSEVWREARQEDVYVACVHQGKVVLVGSKGVRAVSLLEAEKPNDDKAPPGPKPAWGGRIVKLAGGALPAGRGFRTGDRYYLPLSTGEVVAVDLQKGRCSHVSRARKETRPGNLICHKGRVLSQSVTGVELYDQIEFLRQQVEQRLKEQPDDPAALAARGEILLESGNRPEAIEHFRRAYQLDHSPGIRDALRTAFFEALEEDFAAYRDRAEEIEGLIDEPAQRGTYLRLMSAGCQQRGQWRDAFDYYVRLYRLDLDPENLETVAKGHEVRWDRWMQAQLPELRREAGPETQAEIDRVIDEQLRLAVKAEDPDLLRRFLRCFGNHALASQARLRLGDRLAASGNLLEAELLLRYEEASEDPSRSGPAVARLARMLVDAKRADDAEDYLVRLAQELADVTCLEEKTGRQLAEELAGKLHEGGSSTPSGGWPKGRVEVKEPDTSKRSPSPFYGRYSLDCQASRPPLLRDMTVMLDQNRRQLVAFDGLGREHWQLSFATSTQHQQFIYNSQRSPATVNGHQLVLVSTQSVLAVDMLGSGGPSSAKLLWTQSLQDSVITDPNKRQIVIQAMNPQFAVQPPQPTRYSSLSKDRLGPVTEQYVCFQRFRKLMAVDPISGHTLWVRHDIDPGSVLFGDDQFVFAVGPQDAKAKVLRALDGTLLEERELPPADQCLGALGRRILVLRQVGNEQCLELFDPWHRRSQWKSPHFALNSLTTLVKNEMFGVLEPDGHFLLIDLQNGNNIVDAKVQREESLSEILVYPLGEQIILILHSPHRSAPPANVSVYPMPGASYKQIMRGNVYAFDRSGNRLWKDPVLVENRHLVLSQPSRLPVLVFASRIREIENNRSRYKSWVLCIDKRTGRKVVDGKFPSSSSSPSLIAIVGDPEKHRVELQLTTGTVGLTFTDKPPDEGKEPKPPASKTSKQAEEAAKATKSDPPGDVETEEEVDAPALNQRRDAKQPPLPRKAGSAVVEGVAVD